MEQATYFYLSERQIIYLCVFQMKIYYYATATGEERFESNHQKTRAETKLLSVFCTGDNESSSFGTANKYSSLIDDSELAFHGKCGSVAPHKQADWTPN